MCMKIKIKNKICNNFISKYSRVCNLRPQFAICRRIGIYNELTRFSGLNWTGLVDGTVDSPSGAKNDFVSPIFRIVIELNKWFYCVIKAVMDNSAEQLVIILTD